MVEYQATLKGIRSELHGRELKTLEIQENIKETQSEIDDIVENSKFIDAAFKEEMGKILEQIDIFDNAIKDDLDTINDAFKE